MNFDEKNWIWKTCTKCFTRFCVHSESAATECVQCRCNPNGPIKQEFKTTIVWKKFNPDERTAEMNDKPCFVRLKGDNKISICVVSNLCTINKTTDDIDLIAEIPEEFSIFENLIYEAGINLLWAKPDYSMIDSMKSRSL